jgi:phosphatidylserine/phosphatidylglycerophosphate/cardiolipin synthase-like enzyme
MQILSEQQLVDTLRHRVDHANARLWICSPFVGGWTGNVRRILGTNWQRNVGDVRLLTDIDAKGFKLSTMRQFFRRGTVRTLLGLHAKVYVVDDVALVTSANLTGTAFSKRHEAGVLLSG